MSYGKLNVPKFTTVDPVETQRSYFNMVDQNMTSAIATTSAINQANQSEYSRALNQTFGGDYTDTWKSGLNTLKARVEGRWTPEQQEMFDRQSQAKAQRMGLGAAPASINVSMQGFGTQMLRAQESALAQMPSFMTAVRQNLMATPTRVESMFIPISQYASQRAADNISKWRADYAQAQSDHQALMASEALRRQEEQASATKAASIRAQGIATRNAVAMQNAANYRAGVSGLTYRRPSRLKQPTGIISYGGSGRLSGSRATASMSSGFVDNVSAQEEA